MIERPDGPLGFFFESCGEQCVGYSARKLSYLAKGKLLPIHGVGNTIGINPPPSIPKIDYCCHNSVLLYKFIRLSGPWTAPQGRKKIRVFLSF
jgi:hypothetical protein